MDFFEDDNNGTVFSNTGASVSGSATNADSAERKAFVARAYLYMALGLILSFGVAFVESLFLVDFLKNNYQVILVAVVAELMVALIFSFTFRKMSAPVAYLMFFIYAALTGVTLGTVFIYFDMSLICLTFAITAALFIAMALLGTFTKFDMSGWGPCITVSLVGVIIMSLIGVILSLSWLLVFISCVGIVLFMLITAYDARKLSALFDATYGESGTLTSKMCIFGAFQLYLDFINIFYYVLRILSFFNDRN